MTAEQHQLKKSMEAEGWAFALAPYLAPASSFGIECHQIRFAAIAWRGTEAVVCAEDADPLRRVLMDLLEREFR